MEIFLTVLFLGSALTFSLAMTNFFENISKETLTEPAEVRCARENIQPNASCCNGAPLETREYHITFFLPSTGKNLKCRVPKKMLNDFKVGMTGQITHKGTWFKCFVEDAQGLVIKK